MKHRVDTVCGFFLDSEASVMMEKKYSIQLKRAFFKPLVSPKTPL